VLTTLVGGGAFFFGLMIEEAGRADGVAAAAAALDFAFADLAAAPDDGAWAAALAVPPPPGTVTTWTAAAGFELVVLPERPIRTPTPSASSSVPTPAISEVVEDRRGRGGARVRTRVGPALRDVAGRDGSAEGPRRSPHCKQ
jgi:hypothetical protein